MIGFASTYCPITFFKMKRLLAYIIFLSIVSCEAQTVVAIYDGPMSIPTNSYLKDTYNDFGPLAGKWKLTMGKGSSLTIELKKITKAHRPSGKSYTDLLVGEYTYEQSFQVLVDGLPLVLDSSIGYTNHSIYGGVIGDSTMPGAPDCPECPSNARYISVRLTDPSKPGIYGEMIMVRFVQNGTAKLRIRVLDKYDANYASGASTTPQNLTLPEGIYTLTKQ